MPVPDDETLDVRRRRIGRVLEVGGLRSTIVDDLRGDSATVEWRLSCWERAFGPGFKEIASRVEAMEGTEGSGALAVAFAREQTRRSQAMAFLQYAISGGWHNEIGRWSWVARSYLADVAALLGNREAERRFTELSRTLQTALPKVASTPWRTLHANLNVRVATLDAKPRPPVAFRNHSATRAIEITDDMGRREAQAAALVAERAALWGEWTTAVDDAGRRQEIRALRTLSQQINALRIELQRSARGLEHARCREQLADVGEQMEALKSRLRPLAVAAPPVAPPASAPTHVPPETTPRASPSAIETPVEAVVEVPPPESLPEWPVGLVPLSSPAPREQVAEVPRPRPEPQAQAQVRAQSQPTPRLSNGQLAGFAMVLLATAVVVSERLRQPPPPVEAPTPPAVATPTPKRTPKHPAGSRRKQTPPPPQAAVPPETGTAPAPPMAERVPPESTVSQPVPTRDTLALARIAHALAAAQDDATVADYVRAGQRLHGAAEYVSALRAAHPDDWAVDSVAWVVSAKQAEIHNRCEEARATTGRGPPCP